jgi:hypothetical protein
MVWEDAVGSTGVQKETPVGDLVLHLDPLPCGYGVEPPRAGYFPDQVQGARHVLALAL